MNLQYPLLQAKTTTKPVQATVSISSADVSATKCTAVLNVNSPKSVRKTVTAASAGSVSMRAEKSVTAHMDFTGKGVIRVRISFLSTQLYTGHSLKLKKLFTWLNL